MEFRILIHEESPKMFGVAMSSGRMGFDLTFNAEILDKADQWALLMQDNPTTIREGDIEFELRNERFYFREFVDTNYHEQSVPWILAKAVMRVLFEQHSTSY